MIDNNAQSQAVADRTIDSAGASSSARREFIGFFGYLLIQVFCVAGLVSARYPDSYGYFHLSFVGHAEFPPTVPLVYAILHGDSSRVAFQSGLATLAWWCLARVAAQGVIDRRLRLGLRIVVLMLGVVGPVVSWNTVILSESMAISLTALGVATWIWFQKQPNVFRACLALLVTEAWVLTKPAQIYIGAFFAVVSLIYGCFGRDRLIRIAAALGFLALSGFNLITFGNDSNINVGVLSDVIQDRILVNPDYTAWFVQHGMPYSNAIAQAAGGAFGTALQDIPVMDHWLMKSGPSMYERFVLVHPVYALIDPLPSLSGELASVQVQPNPIYIGTQPNPVPSMLSPTANYGRHRQVLPSVVEDFLFEQGQIGNLIALGAPAIVAAILVFRRTRDRRLLIPLLLVIGAIVYVYFVWIASGVGELDRLAVVDAVMIRIGLWLMLAYALDRLLTDRILSVRPWSLTPPREKKTRSKPPVLR